MLDASYVNVLVTGASGFIGSALVRDLELEGHSVRTLVRDKTQVGPSAFYWDPAQLLVDDAAWESVDAVVHLAGKSIASKRWTRSLKSEIYSSRVDGTTLLATAMASLEHPPRAFLSASAVGFYGDTGPIAVSEESPPGQGFLAELCMDWEEATAPAAESGVRVVIVRIGVVIETILDKMLPFFKLGLGGRAGRGDQSMSWIARTDLVNVFRFLLENDWVGPVNAVSPQVITNADFTRVLGNALDKPTPFPVPTIALKLLMGGEMAEETILKSNAVEPKRLGDAHYPFSLASIDDAVRAHLNQ